MPNKWFIRHVKNSICSKFWPPTSIDLSGSRRSLQPFSGIEFPEEAVEAIARCLPNLDRLSKKVYVEGFPIAMRVLIGILLVAVPFYRIHGFCQLSGERNRFFCM
jgi:hypothetical protein